MEATPSWRPGEETLHMLAPNWRLGKLMVIGVTSLLNLILEATLAFDLLTQ